MDTLLWRTPGLKRQHFREAYIYPILESSLSHLGYVLKLDFPTMLGYGWRILRSTAESCR